MAIKFNPKGYNSEKAKSAGSRFQIPPAGSDVRMTVMRDGTEEAPNKKGTGKNTVVKFEVDPGQPGEGYWMSWYIPHDSEFTNSLTGAVMEGCGLDVSKPQDIKPALFFDRKAIGHVKHETYNGEVRAKIAYFLPMDPKDRKVGRGAGKPAPAVDPAPSADDDVPF